MQTHQIVISYATSDGVHVCVPLPVPVCAFLFTRASVRLAWSNGVRYFIFIVLSFYGSVSLWTWWMNLWFQSHDKPPACFVSLQACLRIMCVCVYVCEMRYVCWQMGPPFDVIPCVADCGLSAPTTDSNFTWITKLNLKGIHRQWGRHVPVSEIMISSKICVFICLFSFEREASAFADRSLIRWTVYYCFDRKSIHSTGRNAVRISEATTSTPTNKTIEIITFARAKRTQRNNETAICRIDAHCACLKL